MTTATRSRFFLHCFVPITLYCGYYRAPHPSSIAPTKIVTVFFFFFWSLDLEWDLYKNVYGQHLAQDIVSEEVARFLHNKSPSRPLVLSFHGSSGTGKTLVSSMLGNHLYGSAMSSPYVHQFVPTLHFPLPHRIKQYRVCWERQMVICKIRSNVLVVLLCVHYKMFVDHNKGKFECCHS